MVMIYLLMNVHHVFSQNGLGFSSHEVIQDKRTGLDLFPSNPFCASGDFELSFDLNFYPDQENYFGYIVRIIDDEGFSIDLVYDQNFRIVVGEKLSSIAFNIPEEHLFSKWSRINIGFNVGKKQLRLQCNGKDMRESLPLADGRCYRIYFGAIDYKHYSSTDIPAMKIKDIRISQKKGVTHYWPLDEKNGTIAHDQLNSSPSLVSNPLWVNKLHFDWQSLQSFRTSGNASFAFDPTSERVFLIGSDSLISYNLRSNKKEVTPYASGKLYLPDGNQSIYDTITNSLINFNVDQQRAMKFNWQTKEWSNNYLYPAEKTNHGHANKFISPIDGSLYVLGGYGNFSYKNDVHKYVVEKNQWELIDSQANNLTPHYLAALGAVKGGAYLLGGYGSVSGKQVLNPKNFYDLVYFDVAKQTFTKKYVLRAFGENFVFANSLIIDEKNKDFYGLIFSKHRFQSHLQLIKGTLDNPQYVLLGNRIPYQFSDAHSYADLYYSFANKQFVAVTSYLDSQGITSAQIHVLSNPPLPAVAESLVVKKSIVPGRLEIIGLGVLGGLAIVAFFYLKKRKSPYTPASVEQIVDKPIVEPVRLKLEETQASVKIYLFGDFSVLNEKGEDITKHFTPLLKELFLLILLYTLRWKKGISSEKLIDILWYDKSEESARNNRSANVAKLKQVLDKCSCIKLLKEGNHWRLEWPVSSYIDYQLYLDLIQEKEADKSLIISCSKITKRGSFLSGIEYEWLDAFKSEVSTKIVSTYLQQMQSLPIDGNADLLINLANEVFLFDPVNEEAVIIKCKALASIGQHSQAAHAFESFSKEYELLYGQKFEKNFKSIMAN